jgi:Family of unknown function (DUF5906)
MDNVARGNEQHYNWIIGWWAQIIQEPTVKPGTSLVIKGKQGTGKTIIGRLIGGGLLGRHYELVADQRWVIGQFNSHMAALLVLHADEAFWAGDKRAEGVLKNLVTGDKNQIEFKGKERILVANFMRLFITANHDWVVPADFGERRPAVFDISEDHIRDYEYFAAIEHEWDYGGKEAMLHYLKNFDLKQVNLREIPRTAGLLEQIMATATPEQSWWHDTLVNGTLPFGVSEQNTCPKRSLYRRYIRHAQLRGVNRRQIEVTIGMFLKKCVGPELQSDKKCDYDVLNRYGQKLKERGYLYSFPPLKVCRERFAKAIGQEVSWNEPEADWQHEPEATVRDDELPF